MGRLRKVRRSIATAAGLALLIGGCGTSAAPDARSGAPAGPTTGASKITKARPPAPAQSKVVDAAVSRLTKLGKPVYCGGTRGNAVALTFDDGPGPYTHFALK